MNDTQRTRQVLTAAAFCLLWVCGSSAFRAQQTCTPSNAQDPSLDNLIHAVDYPAIDPGGLGELLEIGHGPQSMVLIAGAGFGPDVFRGFMEANADRYSMIAVGLPGFAGSFAPSMPEEGTSYAAQSWTLAARDGIAQLIEERELHQPIVVGHWINATQVALELALSRPEEIGGVVLVSGVPKSVRIAGIVDPDPKMRALMVDMQMAPGWFKTVTHETWDDNNFLPGDYAIHPLRGLQLWKQAAMAPLPVHVRYLCEFWAVDTTRKLRRLTVPLLIVKPRFDDAYAAVPQPGQGYMDMFLRDSWDGIEAEPPWVTVREIQDSRVFVMDDQPEALNRTIAEFSAGLKELRASIDGRPRRQDRPQDDEAETEAELDYWSGELLPAAERTGMAGGTLSAAVPTGWTLQGVSGEPPLVARILDPQARELVSVQVFPIPGMTLESVVPMIETQLDRQGDGFELTAKSPARIAGRDSVRLEGRYDRDVDPEVVALVVTRIDDDFLLTLAWRSSLEEFQQMGAAFDEIVDGFRIER